MEETKNIDIRQHIGEIASTINSACVIGGSILALAEKFLGDKYPHLKTASIIINIVGQIAKTLSKE
ncbi:hypothetical protein IY974_04250, partial [Campylobacter volucris]|uniref:hypothetical protein n=1 Tax=Campylobacter volucris TaxID=1031542 RepID=UPI00189F9F3E